MTMNNDDKNNPSENTPLDDAQKESSSINDHSADETIASSTNDNVAEKTEQVENKAEDQSTTENKESAESNEQLTQARANQSQTTQSHTTKPHTTKPHTTKQEQEHEQKHCCDCHGDKKEKTAQTEEAATAPEIKKTWQNKHIWKRGVAMLGYGFVAGFVRMGVTFIAIFQFFALLFSEHPNRPLVRFGQNLNTYLYQINQFLTINSEVYPFPFADWPEGSPERNSDCDSDRNSDSVNNV